jgi:hypothetical protein
MLLILLLRVFLFLLLHLLSLPRLRPCFLLYFPCSRLQYCFDWFWE